MVMECCLCTVCVCVDSSLLPVDGGWDSTRESVIAKSSVNRGHPVSRLFEIIHIITASTVYCGNLLAAPIV